MKKIYHPPFTLTNRMTRLVSEIAELIGAWKAANQNTLVPALRRGNRIKTIQASLAVEQNTLSVEQVTAVLDGKSVLGTSKEIQEVFITGILPSFSKSRCAGFDFVPR